MGKFPYELNKVENKKYENILKNIQDKPLEFPINNKISSKFKNFLSKLLDKNYSTRINIQQALNDPWIKGAEIIQEEKENLGSIENFLAKLITDNIPKFNEYISDKLDSFF